MFGFGLSKRVKELEKELAAIKKQISVVTHKEPDGFWYSVPLHRECTIPVSKAVKMLMEHQKLEFKHNPEKKTPESITLIKSK